MCVSSSFSFTPLLLMPRMCQTIDSLFTGNSRESRRKKEMCVCADTITRAKCNRRTPAEEPKADPFFSLKHAISGICSEEFRGCCRKRKSSAK